MKNDTVNAETGTRSVVNRPFWLASGSVSGANVTLYVSPGRMRFPYTTKVVYSGQPNAVTFGGLASRYYTVFVRSDQTYYVSGSTTATVPGPKYQDSEYLGQVWTGASLSTANLQGPWNQGANFNPYEQRGEAAAITAAVPVLYQTRPSLASSPANFTAGATASGIGWLNFNDRSASLGPISAFTAHVRWLASGQLANAGYLLPSGFLQITPRFQVLRGDNLSQMGIHSNTHLFIQQQNPDATTGSEITTTFVIPNTGVGNYDTANRGYQLLLDTIDPTATSSQMRIQQVIFAAVPGYRAPEGNSSSEPV